MKGNVRQSLHVTVAGYPMKWDNMGIQKHDKKDPKCWAAVIGGCGGGMSREHLVSQCAFVSKNVKVRGLPWCQREFREVSVANLTSNVLCKHHNEKLSPLDEEFKSFRLNVAKIAESNDARQPKRSVDYLHVDGKLFTRWAAKTYCNLLSAERTEPRTDLVRFTFSHGTSRTFGFYMLVRKGLVLDFDPDKVLRFGELRSKSGEFIAQLIIYGLPFVLMNFELTRDEVVDLPRGPSAVGRRNLMQPRQIKFNIGNRICCLVFRWA